MDGELEALMTAFFAAVSFDAGGSPSYGSLRELLVPGALLINNAGETPDICTVDAFIEPRQALVDAGTLTEFAEFELHAITESFGRVAHRLSTYGKRGVRDGVPFAAVGVISTQFVETSAGWRISAMAWDDERPGRPVPDRYRPLPPG